MSFVDKEFKNAITKLNAPTTSPTQNPDGGGPSFTVPGSVPAGKTRSEPSKEHDPWSGYQRYVADGTLHDRRASASGDAHVKERPFPSAFLAPHDHGGGGGGGADGVHLVEPNLSRNFDIKNWSPGTNQGKR